MTRQTQTQGWWGERFLSYLQGMQIGPESEGQAKSAWRAEGQVRIQKGRISAKVWVSERKQVEATLRIRPWTEREWRRAIDAMAAAPELARQVLAGTLGAELEEAVLALEQPLFPPPGPGAARCTCGQRSFTCRHLNYLAVQTAEMLDGSPFLWLEVLGRSRPDLLAELKGRLSDQAGPPASPVEGEVALTAPEAGEPLDPARFWQSDSDPATIPVRPGGSAAPFALIHSLGPLPVEEPLYLLPEREPRRADELVRKMVVQIARTAAALTLGELEPAYQQAPGPGRPVSLAARLAQEIEEAVRTEDALLLIDDLHDLCPTAATLGEEGRKPLQEACTLLPSDLITVADRHVGPAPALLRGATFHHVVTLDEYLDGEAGPDADWVRALTAAHRPWPSLAPWFARLQPEVGDELAIELADGSMDVRLKRRADRDPTERLHSDAVASRLLQVMTGMAPSGSLTEQEGVACLLAEGGYRGDLHPDPLWLVPLLGPGLYQDPAARALTRQHNTWRPSLPRFVYGVWPGRDGAVMGFQAQLLQAGEDRRAVEEATACIAWWGRLWPGAQDQPGAADSLGPFLHFLWNIAPREAARQRIPPERVPAVMARWFAFLEESYPGAAGAFTRHRLACSLLDHYADRCRTVPPDGAGEGSVLAWQAEAFRWIGPAHYLSGGSYR